MISAEPADLPEVDAFLAAHVTHAMFPLTNLRQHGVTGDHPHALTLWLTRRGGRLTDVLALSRAGMVLPVLPSQDYAAAARVLAGHAVAGVLGRQDWARGVAQACPLTSPRTLDRDEPQFLLDLNDLQVAPGSGQLIPLAEAPEATIKTWIHAYMIEALDTPKAQADREVSVRYDRYCSAGSHVVLMEGPQPLAMTGFNARLPQIVQIGGVYTPPDLRGQGHARRAIGQHLAQAKAAGVQRAVLFSASDAASQAYRAVGFRQIGHWTLLLLAEKEMVRG